MKILVNISGVVFLGAPESSHCERRLMRVTGEHHSHIGPAMTSFYHKNVMMEGNTPVDKPHPGRFVSSLAKVSPERGIMATESFGNGCLPYKSKLDVRTRHGSGSSLLSSSSSALSLAKPAYSSRSKTELEMTRAPTRVLEPEDLKPVGSLVASPKWSRIKEAFEGADDSSAALSKNHSRSTSSLPRPLAQKISESIKRTESCDRGSRYRPKVTSPSSKSPVRDDSRKMEESHRKINLDFDPNLKATTRDRQYSQEISETRERRLKLESEISLKSRYADSEDKSKKSVLCEDSQHSRTRNLQTCSSDSDVTRKTRSANMDSVSTKSFSSETYNSKLSRFRSSRSEHSDSELVVRSRPDSKGERLGALRDIHDSSVTRKELRDSGSTRREMRDSEVSRQETRDSGMTRQEMRDSRVSRREVSDSRVNLQEMRDSNATRRELRDSNARRQELRDSKVTRHDMRDSRATRQEIRDSSTTRREMRDSSASRQDMRDSRVTKSEIRDSSLTRYRNCKYDSDPDIVSTQKALPDMESIKSLKLYLKEIQDSKLNRQRFLKSNTVSTDRLTVNVSISSERESKRSKSFLTDVTETKPAKCTISGTESQSFHSKALVTGTTEPKPTRTESQTFHSDKSLYLDWETNATQSYLKKLEETKAARIKMRKKLDPDFQPEPPKIDLPGHAKPHDLIPPDKITNVERQSSFRSLEVDGVHKRGGKEDSESCTQLLAPMKKAVTAAPAARPKSAVSPLTENYAPLVKLERGLTFHGPLVGQKGNLPGWKMNSSGSWIKVQMEKEALASTLKSRVALLAHQFDHLKNSGGESPISELVVFQNNELSPEKTKVGFQSLDALCCPMFMSVKSQEERNPPQKGICAAEKVITSESRKLGLVKQVVQSFEESVQKSSPSSESDTSPTYGKSEISSLDKKWANSPSTRAPDNIDRKLENGAKDNSSPRSQRHLNLNDTKSRKTEERECKTYSSFSGKSKPPSNSKLTVPPLPSRMAQSSVSIKGAHQRPSIPPPRKPTKSYSSESPKSTTSSTDGESSLLAELEKWLVQKYDNKEQQVSSCRQPNESFLWKKLGPQLSNGSDDSIRKSESSDEPGPGYYSSPFTQTPGDEDEHIYMEATFNRPRSTLEGDAGHDNAFHGSSCDSDEGWVDVDDAELEQIIQESKDSDSEVLIRSRPRNVKAHCVRRSWMQSVRDKTCTTKEWAQKDYKDITVWETEENEGEASSSSSTTSDHLYEALYDVIMPEDETEHEDTSPQDLTSVSVDTGINETSLSCENLNETNRLPCDTFPESDTNEQGLKRNWSLTKSDIRLELTSKLNKVKVRKDVHSAADVIEPESDTEVVTSKKKTLIKFILRQKNNTAIKKRTHKKGATFYVRWSKFDRETRECNNQSETAAGTSEVDGKKVVTLKRKPSNLVRRPTTPPPLPPIAAAGQVRSHDGTKSLEILRSSSSSLSSVDKSKSLDSSQICKLEQGNESALHRNDSFTTRSSYSSSQGSCSPSSSSQSSHETANGNCYLLLPKSRGSVASSHSSHSGNGYIPEDEVASYPKPSHLNLPSTLEEEGRYLSLRKDQTEALRSPFEEEPLYQFYQKRVKQRATKLQTMVIMDEEQDDPYGKNRGSELNLSPVSVSSSSSGIPSAMELLHHDIGNQRTLWCEVPEVRNSGILEQVTMPERKLQEAMFEVITSEASYLKSLNVLIEHFMECPEFSDDFSLSCVLGRRERHVLFSDVIPVREVSIRLLSDLEQRWQENILISNICDILYEHASKFFNVYVKYCANQVYQDRILKEMKATRPDFITVLQRLESNPACQGLDMLSFLMLPMQRITRMPLLVDAIFHRLTTDSPYYEICKLTLVTLNKVVGECNEAARKMERMEEMLVISRQLDFKGCKSIPLISASRWLVKKGELIRLLYDNPGRNRTFGRSARYTRVSLYLFLFTDLLLITRKKSDESFIVLDYCPRNLVQVFSLEDAGVPMPGKLSESHKNVFQLTMLQNHEFKTVELILGCPLESDRTRWMEAVTPPVSENPEEKIYEEWDCPQAQCIYPYFAKQPDELTLEESDVVNVFRKMPDGWFEGERLRDGIKGWFPASFAVEIISSHIRARNLRQRYRLLMLSQAYVEEQRKAFLLDKSDKSK